ncbi:MULTISPECIES: tetratricopeptide repeat protein [unclassified Nocardioides]|uniref:tetratricopeptide repeat protein n=1 Tax=unclassified Nocardioides TaxID=2615069 RepID=UPI0009E8BE6C|nr:MULTISPECIES: tetratricopeptide repeat protein [unclassified Nocardioides]
MSEIRLQAPVMAPIDGWRPGATREHASAYRTAHDLLSRNAPREALEVLEPALVEEPANRGLRSLRAWAFFQSAHLAKATAELTTLVEEDPTDTWSRHTLGRSLERQSKYDEALPHLRLAAVMTGDPEHEYDVLRVERSAGRVG